MCWDSPLQMLKFGIPVPAAQLKMIAEGLNPLVLECDPDKPLPKKYVVKDVVDEMEAYTDGPKLGEHEVYAKYFKVRCTQHAMRVVHGLVQASARGGLLSGIVCRVSLRGRAVCLLLALCEPY